MEFLKQTPLAMIKDKCVVFKFVFKESLINPEFALYHTVHMNDIDKFFYFQILVPWHAKINIY